MSINETKEVQLEPQNVKQVDTSIKITLDEYFRQLDEYFRQLAEMSGGNDLSSTSSTKA
jgi:hypothetical protein